MTVAADLIVELMTQSLVAWGRAGHVRPTGDGAVVECDGREIRIAPAPPGLPFRWMVSSGPRTRGAVSVAAVLRQVRAALDPGYAARRVRVTAYPLVRP